MKAITAILTAWMVFASAGIGAPPPNDSFAKATRLSAANVVQEFNTEATVEPGEPRHLGATGPYGRSIWWSWTAPSPGALRADLSGMPVGMALAAYSGSSVSNLTLLSSNGPFGFRVVRVAPGTKVYLAADGTNEAPVQFSLNFTAAPVNDYFTNRSTFAGSTGAVAGTTVEASVEPGEPFSSQPTVWWTWTAPATSPTTFQFFDDSHAIEVYTNSTLTTLRALSPSEFGWAGQRKYILQARAGGTYQIRLRANANGTVGPASFIWYQATGLVPPNDNLAQKALLTGTNLTVSGALTGATREAGEPPHNGSVAGNASVWYGWRAPGNGTVKFSLVAADFNIAAAFYGGTTYGALAPLGYLAGTQPGASASFGVSAGSDYSVAVESPLSTATFTFRIEFIPAPANDDFANAIFVGSGNVVASGTTAGATKEPGEADHAGSTSRTSTVWWRWTSAGTGPVTIATVTSQLDPVLAVYIETAAGLEVVAANNNYTTENQDSRVTFDATAGRDYYIAAATRPGESGALGIDVHYGRPPSLTWNEPTTDVVVPLGSNVDVSVTASAGSAAVSSMWLKNGPALVATATGTTLAHTLVNPDYGTYTLYAYAADGDSLVGVSGPRVVRVAPANDWFTNRISIPQDTMSVTGTMSGVMRDADEPRQLSSSTRVAWWSWIAPTNGTIYLEATNAGASANSYALAVYAGEFLPSLTVVRASGAGRVMFNAEAGIEYHIAGESSNGGEFVIRFVSPMAAENDYFTNATPIFGTNVVIVASNAEATSELGEPAHGGYGPSKSLWWTWTAPTNGFVQLRTAGSSIDTTLAVYTGVTLTSVTKVDWNRTSSVSGNSSVSFFATNGVLYRIAADGYMGASGLINLSLSFWCSPENDMFAQRIALSGRTNNVGGNNSGATFETGEPTGSIFGVRRTMWWSWTAPVSGRVLVNTAGSQVKNTVGIYTGAAVGSLTTVKTAADIIRSNTVAEFDAMAGTVYQIAVDSQTTPGGEIHLNILQPNTAGNDQFANRIAISGYEANVQGSTFNATREAGEPMHDVNPHRSVWWSWTATENGWVSIAPFGGTIPGIAVYTGTTPGSLAPVTVNGPYIGAATFQAVAGTEYQLAFFMPFNGMGEVQFSIVSNAPPAIELGSPADGSVFFTGQCGTNATGIVICTGHSIITTANASDGNGAVTNVVFTLDSTARWSAATPFAGAIFTDVAAGDHILYARAFDEFGAYATAGPITVHVTTTNDLFAYATTLTGESADVAISNAGGTLEPGEPQHGGWPGGRSMWFAWTAPRSGVFSLSTEGSAMDTLLGVYVGTDVNMLTLVASNNNRTSFDPWSEVTFSAQQGVTYRIAVDGAYREHGAILLKLRAVAANDSFASAAQVTGNWLVQASNFGAGLEDGEPPLSAYEGGSLWWSWTAPNSGNYLATTAGTGFDTLLGVYSGPSISNLTAIAVDDDGAGNGESLARFFAKSGETIRIAVASYGPERGLVQLVVATNGAPTLFAPRAGGTNMLSFSALTPPGSTNVMCRSTNLANWTAVVTNVAAQWWTEFLDVPGTNRPAAFYRVESK